MTQLPILILPGTLCTETMFTHQINQLSQHCEKVSVVPFTTENTLADMAQKVIAATHNQPCAMIGFSMGGIVALEVAKTRPDLIAKLALINSNCHADLPERKAARHAQISQAKAGQLTELIKTVFLPNYLFEAKPENQALIIDMAETLGADCFAAQAMSLEDRPDSLATLKKVTKDLLIIGGAQDKICPPEHQHVMHQATSGSQLALLEQCGHFSPIEQPEQVSSLLTNWYLAR